MELYNLFTNSFTYILKYTYSYINFSPATIILNLISHKINCVNKLFNLITMLFNFKTFVHNSKSRSNVKQRVKNLILENQVVN